MSKRKTFRHIFLVLPIIIAIIVSIMVTNVHGAADYGKALSMAIQFYDANKCGPDVTEDQSFYWRGKCHTQDGKDVGLDLTGGFHDAGDHVKFGLPQGYTASILAWSMHEYGDSMGGAKSKLTEIMKYFTDYFQRCHPTSDKFYYQIGEGEIDHTYWGPPEDQTEDRPSLYYADKTHAASDVLGITAAALAIDYLNTKNEASLKTAEELFALGKAKEGYGNGQSYYQSSSYGDDMAWGACWLAEATGDKSYIEDAEKYVNIRNKQDNDMFKHKWAICWDDMYLAAFYKLYELTGDQKYADAIDYNFDYWMNDLTTSPGGMKFLHNWGCLRYNATQSFFALLWYDKTKNEKLKSLAKKQIDYILGDNPKNMSYIIGYGSKWSLHPHHRAANGRTYANSGNTEEAMYTLSGALVGGPDQTDTYKDDANEYQYTEVAIDYNAGLVGALAGMVNHEGGTVPEVKKESAPTSQETEPSVPLPEGINGIDVDYTMNDWGSGATVTITIKNSTNTDINNGWQLVFDFGGKQKIDNGWESTYSQDDQRVTVKSSSGNAKIAAGKSIQMGFNVSYTGRNTKPTAFSFIPN